MDDQNSSSSSVNEQKALSSSNDGQQGLLSSMDIQKIASSSLDGQREYIPHTCDESWFDLANPCGKEFELPNVSDPMSVDLSFNSNNLVVSPFQRLDAPSVLDDDFALEMTGPSSAGNQLASLPLIEMVPSVTNNLSVVDQQGGVSLANQKLYAAGPSKSPSFSLIDSWYQQNKFSHIVSSGNTPWFSPDICIPPNIASASNRSQLGTSICIIKDHTQISGFGCSSSLEANGSHTMSYHLIGPSGLADAPRFLSSGSCIISNEEVGVPVNSNTPVFRTNVYEHDGPQHLQNSNQRTGIRSNLSTPMKSQGLTPTGAPLSNYCRSIGNQQTFGTSSLQIGRPSFNGEVSCFSHMYRINGEIRYICKECQKDFPNYNAFGGHMSFHAKARKMTSKLTNPISACPVEATDKKLEVNNFNKEKGKLLTTSEEEYSVEKLSLSGDRVKEDFCQPHKKAREGAHIPKNSAETKTSSLCEAQKKEPSSSTVEQNGNEDQTESDDPHHSPSH